MLKKNLNLIREKKVKKIEKNVREKKIEKMKKKSNPKKKSDRKKKIEKSFFSVTGILISRYRLCVMTQS